MKALTWQGPENVTVEEVPDPRIEQSTDAIIRVTSTAICGSDLHLYGVLAPYLKSGDVLGHEAMGVVEEVGPETGDLKVGDRVVVPFNVSCGHCWMCTRGLQSQCETTQVTDQGKGAALFGYTSLYGSVPGGQAEYLRVPQAQYGPIRVPEDGPDERYLYLSDILPTAWQAARYADVTEGSTLLVIGLGPVGQMTVRSARKMGAERVLAADLVPERLAMAASHGAETIDLRSVDDLPGMVRELTQGRGVDGAVDAVGMEAHGNPVAEQVIKLVGRAPKPLARKAIETMGIDRLAALYASMDSVRRGGTVSLSGVYGGTADPMPLMDMFDKQLTLRMGQANVRRWSGELLDILRKDESAFDVEAFATHHLPLREAPEGYKMFQEKADGCIKVVLKPEHAGAA
ncbi:glutathione-dependent formaldehyde dehydrogenase [Luteipulveratus sp. YIM 133132]|uniref:zinc-dependent alcohol dehydrogenase n=1 Tax=Luteipulveratus flavus TaxID=3031728 RepID=UPI0023B0142F|nr:zinc-dependent alcohol dehydrogenase [Luteipulveratus sp. YIM 133132]MDE9365702.1 glutathione-dependent formaldehyde dehydrogenase [Luteipulveratus sp. YIM 133132]